MSDEEFGGQETEASTTVHHDDIVKRLVEYQRHLREGASPQEAARLATSGMPPTDYPAFEEQQVIVTETEEIVDLTTAEAGTGPETIPSPWVVSGPITVPEAESAKQPEAPAVLETPEAEAPAVESDLAERIISLERTLSDLAKDLRDLRGESQNYALVVDDRLSAIQAKIDEATGGATAES